MKKRTEKNVRTRHANRSAANENAFKDPERWWLKYEAAGSLDEEFPPHPDLTFSLLNSVHRHRLRNASLTVNLKEDSRHHIAMQKFFKKWQEVYGTRF